MNDKEQELKELKADLYDAGKQMQNMNAILTEVVKRVGLEGEEGVDIQTLLERLDYLVSLEPKESE